MNFTFDAAYRPLEPAGWRAYLVQHPRIQAAGDDIPAARAALLEAVREVFPDVTLIDQINQGDVVETVADTEASVGDGRARRYLGVGMRGTVIYRYVRTAPAYDVEFPDEQSGAPILARGIPATNVVLVSRGREDDA